MTIQTLIQAFKKKPHHYEALVSNPPYQQEIQGNSIQSYGEHYQLATHISKNISMIFPLTWQTTNGRAAGSKTHATLKEDTKLAIVNNYPENNTTPLRLFPDVYTGGVSIVFHSEHHTGPTKYYEQGIFKEFRNFKNQEISDPTLQTIIANIMRYRAKNNIQTMDQLVSKQRAHYRTTNIFKLYKNDENIISQTPKAGWHKTWGSLNETYGWFWVSPEGNLCMTDRPTWEAHKYKVIFGISSRASSVWRKARIFNPHEVFTASFVGVYFNTLQEAENFLTYLKTYFYRALFTATATGINAGAIHHRSLPDLTTVKNPRTGLVGWKSDWTNDDLKILFKDYITLKEWDYIETYARKSDPKAQKLLDEKLL